MDSQAAPRYFQTTHWTMVRKAVGKDDVVAKQALSALCDAYWYPLYAYIRRSGKSPHDAEDLTQGFFARLLENNILTAVDPGKGKLRTFLLACTRNYLSDERDRAMAQKRGGGVLVSFNPEWAEERYTAEPVDDLSPDRLFQRRWALTVLEYSLQLLAEEFKSSGKAELFAALRPFLGFGVHSEKGYDEISRTLGIAVGTLKNHVFRLRDRWRELLVEQVSMTLNDPTPEEIQGELKELLSCL